MESTSSKLPKNIRAYLVKRDSVLLTAPKRIGGTGGGGRKEEEEKGERE